MDNLDQRERRSTFNSRLKSAKINNYHYTKELLMIELNRIYSTELILSRSMPELASYASSGEVIDLVSGHIDLIGQHVCKLEEIFTLLEEEAKEVKCQGLVIILHENFALVNGLEQCSSTREIAIVIAAQKLVLIKLGDYSAVNFLAAALNLVEVTHILADIINEEKKVADAINKISQIDFDYQCLAENELLRFQIF